MKKIKNKQQIKNIIYYLIKWTNWSFKYNFYKFVSHLVDASKAIANYKHRFKHKQKKINKTININRTLNFKNLTASHKQVWDEITCFIQYMMYWMKLWNHMS